MSTNDNIYKFNDEQKSRMERKALDVAFEEYSKLIWEECPVDGIELFHTKIMAKVYEEFEKEEIKILSELGLEGKDAVNTGFDNIDSCIAQGLAYAIGGQDDITDYPVNDLSVHLMAYASAVYAIEQFSGMRDYIKGQFLFSTMHAKDFLESVKFNE